MLEINNVKAKRTTFLLLVIFLFLILLAILIVFTKSMKEEKLSKTIQYVLEQKEEGRYQIGIPINIQLPITVSSSFFELTDVKNRGQDNFVLITRITGLNGPIAVVFIGNTDSIEFTGIAGITNSQLNPLAFGITDTMIHHWKNLLLQAYTRGVKE